MNYSEAIRNERMEVVNKFLSNGKIKIYSAGYEKLLAILSLSNPAGTVSNGKLILSNTPLSGVGLEEGEALTARIVGYNDVVVIDNISAGTQEANFILNDLFIKKDQIVKILSGSIVHA